MVTIGTSLFFAEISGSAVADVAALGSVLIPSMKRAGYSKEFAAAVTSSASTLAVIIPPSIPMILYAVMAGASVVELFVAGIIPGLLGGLLLMAAAYRVAVRRGFPSDSSFRWHRVMTALREAAWALTLPIIILGGIFSGWVTATEGAGLAVLAAALIGGLVYRELNWSVPAAGDPGGRDSDSCCDALGFHIGAPRRIPDGDAGSPANSQNTC